MKIIIFALCVTLFQQTNAQSYKKIHRKAIVVDTHNDILMKAADEGMVFEILGGNFLRVLKANEVE